MGQIAKDIRSQNVAKVLDYLYTHSITNRAEMSRELGISMPTALRIVDELFQYGYVVESEYSTKGVGRKPVGISFNPTSMYLAVVLHEGERVYVAVLNARGDVVRSIEALSETDFHGFFKVQLPTLLNKLLSDSGIALDKLKYIGIGLPAILDPYTGMIYEAPLVGITEKISICEWMKELSDMFNADVFIENDVNIQAFGEHAVRELGTACDMAYVAIGTGVGSGLVLRGEMRRGKNNLAGEIGYALVHNDEQLTTLETLVSGAALQERFGIATNEGIDDTTKEEISLYVAKHLAVVLYNYAAMLDLDLLVLGGYTTKLLGTKLIDAVNKEIDVLAFFKPRIELAKAPNAGFSGFMALIWDRFLKKIDQNGIRESIDR